MTAVSATEFAKNFGHYRMEAQREPVQITSYGRVSGYFVSEREYDELQRLRALMRRVYRIKDLPPKITAAIKASQMNPAHDHLNALADEE